MIRIFAAIDVGSYELELGIYEVSLKYGVRQIDHVCHKIALGKDTYHDGKISYRLVEELCTVLKDFVGIMESYKTAEYRAYAASAMREAKNSRIILDQIRVRTGLEVQIISNSEQRFISCKAIAAKDGEFQKIIRTGTAIADVSFGSMQLSLYEEDALVSTQNIPMGILRLKETLAQLRELPEIEYSVLDELIRNELITFRKMYLKGRNITNLIAVGETLTIIAAHIKNENIHRTSISAEEFLCFCEKLRKMPLTRIQEYLEVNAEHAAFVMAAAVIYKQVLEMTGAKTIWLPGVRLLDGMAAEYAVDCHALKLSHDFDNDIIAASRNMAKRYKCHMAHVFAVEEMALSIFDAAKKIHGMRSRERLLLQIAANLHACGKFISVRSSAECGYRIIMATELLGLSHLEREIVANVVRYHILEFEYNEIQIQHRPFRNDRRLSTGGINTLIAKLTAILRLANATDQSHRQKLQGGIVRMKEEELVITTDWQEGLRVEELAIDQKADFFEEIFGIRPVLRQRRGV